MQTFDKAGGSESFFVFVASARQGSSHDNQLSNRVWQSSCHAATINQGGVLQADADADKSQKVLDKQTAKFAPFEQALFRQWAGLNLRRTNKLYFVVQGGCTRRSLASLMLSCQVRYEQLTNTCSKQLVMARYPVLRRIWPFRVHSDTAAATSGVVNDITPKMHCELISMELPLAWWQKPAHLL